MKKQVTKVIALWISIIMLLGMMPAVVFADPNHPNPPEERPWLQRPVADPGVIVAGPRTGNSYNMIISWTRPQLSTALAATNVPLARLSEPIFIGPPNWTLFPIRYDLDFRNATRGEAFRANPALPLLPVYPPEASAQVRGIPTTRGVSTGQISLTMQPSSLYEIRIDPVRYIPFLHPAATPGGELQPGRTRALPDNSPAGGPPGRGLIFMTDINVHAEGRGNTLTVTWDNPTWGGQNLFPYWEVAFQRYQPGQPVGAAGRVFPVVTGTAVPGQQIQQNPDGTLTMVITDPTIRPIGRYSVRVEPMLGPNLGNQDHRIRTRVTPDHYIPLPQPIGGALFNLAFSPSTSVEYGTDVMMIPELHIDQFGADFIRLWWSHLGALAVPGSPDTPQIQRVYIEEWPPDMEGQAPDDTALRTDILAIIGGEGFITGYNEWLIGPGIPRIRRGFALALILDDDTVLRTNIVVYDPLLADFSPYRPDIYRLYHVGDGNIAMEWLAFARYPAVYEEHDLIPEGDPFNGRIVDTSLEYEIFVSDCWDTLTSLTTPLMVRVPLHLQANYRVNPVRPEPATPQFDPTWRVFPFDFISEYQALTPEGIQNRPIQGNRVYFVRIRAVRVPGGQTSDWAYGSVYVPPLDGLEIRPEMISSPPVKVVQEEITANSIPLQWDTRFLEIMQANPQQDWAPDRDVWHSVVGVDHRTPPNLIFGRSAAHINFVAGLDLDSATPVRHGFLNDIIPDAMHDRLLGRGPNPLNVNNPGAVGMFLAESRISVDGFLTGLGFSPATASPTALRIQDMGHYREVGATREWTSFSYMIHPVRFADVIAAGGFEFYRDSINDNPAVWTSIGVPDIDYGVASHTVTGLSTNEPYIIFIRPYVTIGGEIITAWYPTFVIGTTVEIPPPVVPDPTTPVLIEVPEHTSRRTVGVRWRVQANMVYEIRISHFFTDYPSGGISIPIGWDDIQAALAVSGRDYIVLEGTPQAVLYVRNINEVPYFHLRIFERFPDTTYYIWAFAFGTDQNGVIGSGPSAPSNPVDIRTYDIEPPPPPISLARAPQNLLNMFNRYNDTEYSAGDPDALNISFMRIFDDRRDDFGNPIPRGESGTATGGTARPLNLPNAPETDAYFTLHIIRFEDLRPNARYFVRARTWLTVQRGQDDVFSYEIQVADNEDFLDAITFIIPPLAAMDPINTRRAHSEWVTIEVDTGLYDGEFDGVHRPDQFPLPDRDFEIVYTPGNQTLTWRFRTNQVGADGRPDQNVDQRFISRLVSERTFTYVIDLSHYIFNPAAPITNREVIVPLSIIRAFNERRITLEVNAGDLVYSFPPGFLDTAEVRGLQTGIGSYFNITMNANPNNMPALGPNTRHAMPPQRLGVRVDTPQRNVNVSTFAQPVNIILPMDDFISPTGATASLFQSGAGVQGWQDMRGNHSFATNRLSAQTNRPGTFSGVFREAPPIAGAPMPDPVVPGAPGTVPTPPVAPNPALNRVMSRMTFTDMHTFDPNQVVTSSMFNSIIHAVAHRQTSVTMDRNLTAAETQTLTRGNLLAPANLTREAAIDRLVRLYGVQTAQVVQPMTPESAIPGIAGATDGYIRNIRIAADIGFVSGPLNPQGSLTMGDLIHMLDILMQDAGW